MTKKEFIEKGYLQEVNRQFFHPLGLAMAISFEDEEDLNNDVDGSLSIMDSREDPEGFIFGKFSETSQGKADNISKEFKKREKG